MSNLLKARPVGDIEKCKEILFLEYSPTKSDEVNQKILSGYPETVLNYCLEEVSIENYWVSSIFRFAYEFEYWLKEDERRKKQKEAEKKNIEILWKELKAYQPKVIVCLGMEAFTALTTKTVYTHYSNEGFELTLSENAVSRVYCIPHPKDAVWSDRDIAQEIIHRLVNIKYKALGHQYNTEGLVKIYADTVEKVRAMVDKCINLYDKGEVKYCVLDLETSTYTPYEENAYILLSCISFLPGEAYCVPHDHYESPFTNEERVVVWEMISEIFSHGIPYVNQNIKFDWQWFRAMTPIKENIVLKGDTMLASYYLNGKTVLHELDHLTTTILKRPSYKKKLHNYLKKLKSTSKEAKKLIQYQNDNYGLEGLDKGSYGRVPMNLLLEYGFRDGEDTYLLWEYFEAQLKKEGLLESYNELMLGGTEFVTEMEYNGVLYEEKELEKIGKTLDDEITSLENQLNKNPFYKIAVYTLDPSLKVSVNADKFMAHLFYDTMYFPVYKKRNADEEKFQLYASFLKGKKDSKELHAMRHTWTKMYGVEFVDAFFKEEHLASSEYVKHALEVLDLTLKLRKKKKLYDTYTVSMPSKIDKNGLLHFSYKLHGTVTGRLSATIHTWPKKSDSKKPMRSRFKNGLIGCFDYSQAELRWAGMLSRDKNYQAIYDRGGDLHSEVSLIAFGGDANGQVDPDQRRATKTVNFGLLYGTGVKSLAEKLGIPIDQAQGIYDKVLGASPGIQKFIKAQHKKAEDITIRFMETVYGRRLINKPRWNVKKCDYHRRNQFVNAPIQSVASDATLKAGIALNREFKKRSMKSLCVFMVHDSLGVDIHPDELIEVYMLRLKCMVHDPMTTVPCKFKIPWKSDAEIGISWKEAIDCHIDSETEMITFSCGLKDATQLAAISNNLTNENYQIVGQEIKEKTLSCTFEKY